MSPRSGPRLTIVSRSGTYELVTKAQASVAICVHVLFTLIHVQCIVHSEAIDGACHKRSLPPEEQIPQK